MERIYESAYWKQHCFAINAATLLDKAIQLRFIGGTFANSRPTPFLCLIYKLLLMEPELDIIFEYIQQSEFKYIRALGCFYLRLVADSVTVYTRLEPLLNDYCKLRYKKNDSTFSVLCMDEFIDQLLRDERVCDIILPRLPKRELLEELGKLSPRDSLVVGLEDSLNDPDQVEKVEKDSISNEKSRLKFKKILNISSSASTNTNTNVKQHKDGLDVEETNKLRISLGMKPLK